MRIRVRGDAYDLDASLVAESGAELRRQIEEYAAGEREAFDLGVDYPESHLGDVMRAMNGIPYGETRTYGELATDLDAGAVAVGQACGANPLPIVVPCHRVVGADGRGGFSAAGGVDAKRRLLAFERGEGLDRF
ncbi:MULTISPECIES: methylated-DNA--[protein]-cysteine S-methyltransferase [Halolamina]|uniref:Methylated-DNA-[protein]-cysteine S-methyltransferase n=1 Tax=Halolamina pelagica TaxID=699431 RepID=A0A1I5RVV2_9EURY|nr:MULTISPECIES: methylated-DNA--[protein]-cysteine S-methyltransferase [Halolamina]NHX35373.1 methylated-DNA--[protein]-cysteine S-methyltransferase [Halolamina sp. R1-12]SFP62635.1 methylated-DNA-[protein]-cysteine S-methyltransferase [Halolamina pelagica]